MKAVTKILIAIGFLAVVACIAGAIFEIHRRELPHAGLLATDSTQNVTSPLVGTNDTSHQTVPTEPSMQPDQEVMSNRTKRAIIFRPLFVYRQQEIKKQRYKEMREQQQTTTTTQRPKYASGFSYGSSYNMRG